MDNHINFDNLTEDESKQLTHVLVLLTARKLLQSEDKSLEKDLEQELQSLLEAHYAEPSLSQTATSLPEQGSYMVTEDMHRALQNTNSVCLLGWLIEECQKAKEKTGHPYVETSHKAIKTLFGISRWDIEQCTRQLTDLQLIFTKRCSHGIQYQVNPNWKAIIEEKANLMKKGGKY